MKIEEIRIGIYLQWKNNGSIFSVCELTIVDTDFWNHIRMGDIVPIPITEEWLVDFGFTKIENDIYSDKDETNVFSFYGNYSIHLIFVDYIHQLQNVYLAAEKKDLISTKYPTI